MKQYTFLLEVSEKYVRDIVDKMVDAKDIKSKKDLKKIDTIIKRIGQHSLRSSARINYNEPFNPDIVDNVAREASNAKNRDLMRRIRARLRITRDKLSAQISKNETEQKINRLKAETQRKANEAKLKIEYKKLKKAGLLAAGMTFAAFCAYAYQKHNDKKFNKKT